MSTTDSRPTAATQPEDFDAHDAGLYLKRARVAEALYGGASFHRDRYARLLNY